MSQAQRRGDEGSAATNSVRWGRCALVSQPTRALVRQACPPPTAPARNVVWAVDTVRLQPCLRAAAVCALRGVRRRAVLLCCCLLHARCSLLGWRWAALACAKGESGISAASNPGDQSAVPDGQRPGEMRQDVGPDMETSSAGLCTA